MSPASRTWRKHMQDISFLLKAIAWVRRRRPDDVDTLEGLRSLLSIIVSKFHDPDQGALAKARATLEQRKHRPRWSRKSGLGGGGIQ